LKNTKMKDLSIKLDNRPGALAEMGAVLGQAGVSVEGGDAWVVDGVGVAHLLFHDAAAARKALEAAGISVVAESEVLVQRLRQDVPGQLGLLTGHRAGRGRQYRSPIQRPRSSGQGKTGVRRLVA
jgi:hypothetical protein